MVGGGGTLNMLQDPGHNAGVHLGQHLVLRPPLHHQPVAAPLDPLDCSWALHLLGHILQETLHYMEKYHLRTQDRNFPQKQIKRLQQGIYL